MTWYSRDAVGGGDDVHGGDEGAAAELVVEVDERLPHHLLLLAVEDLRLEGARRAEGGGERVDARLAAPAPALVHQERVQRADACATANDGVYLASLLTVRSTFNATANRCFYFKIAVTLVSS